MGLFDRKEIKKLTQEVTELKKLAANARGFDSMALSNLANRNLAIYPTSDILSQSNRYVTTDDIYSIIKRIAGTAALVPMYGYLQTEDKKSFQKITREQKAWKNPAKYKDLQTKALEDLEDNDPVAMLLENPSEGMSKFEFFEAVHSFLCLAGNCFILKQRPEDGINKGKPIQLKILYPQGVIPKISEALPRRIVAYDYKVNGVSIIENIPAEDVIHIKYFNPTMDYMGSEVLGISPIQVLANRLTRLDSNMNVSVAQLQNGGVETIVYDKMPVEGAVDPNGQAVDVMGKRKDGFYRFLKNPGNAGAPYFASGEMGAISIGSTLADLGVSELANVDFKKLCNAFGISDRLFNNDATGSEVSDDNARKGLYTNTVLPNVFRVRDALVRGLLPDFKDGVLLTDASGDPVRIKGDGKLRFIDADISDITELQQDIAKQVTALASAYWLTPNEKRETMNWERFDNEIFDQPLLPTGLMTLDDLVIPEPIETDTIQ